MEQNPFQEKSLIQLYLVVLIRISLKWRKCKCKMERNYNEYALTQALLSLHEVFEAM